jgi:hypothetical protein
MIERGEPATWNESLFQHYRAFYVTGLERLVDAIMRCRKQESAMALFIPSSVFLEEKVR